VVRVGIVNTKALVMLGRTSSHNCSCATIEGVFSPFKKKPFASGFLTEIVAINLRKFTIMFTA